MKKTVLSFLFAASLSTAAFAQVSFGPKLGLGISNLKQTSGPSYSNTPILTPQVGVVLNAQILITSPFVLNCFLFNEDQKQIWEVVLR